MGHKLRKTEPFSSLYEMGEQLGSGAFGKVNMCVQKSTGLEYAVKSMDIRRFGYNGLKMIDLEERVWFLLKGPKRDRSQSIQVTTNSPYVRPQDRLVRLHDSIRNPATHYFVMDYLAAGDMFEDIIAQEQEIYSEAVASEYMEQIFHCIQYVHQMGVIHRDIKPDNFLLASKGRGGLIKLIDFGMAKEVEGDKKERFGPDMTKVILPPEAARNRPYGKPVDMWGCGVVMYFMLMGEWPFDDDDVTVARMETGRFNYEYDVDEDLSDASVDLLRQLLHRDDTARITAAQALQHPWICKRETEARTKPLTQTVDKIKKFKARGKFKGAAHAALMAQRIKQATEPEAPSPQPQARRETKADVPRRREQKIESIKPVNPQESQARKQDIVRLTEQLLAAITGGDYDQYKKSIYNDITCFEPESSGNLIEGREFHKFYFDHVLGKNNKAALSTTVLNPHVSLIGDNAACIAYVRLTQHVDREGVPHTSRSEETRVWHRRDGAWQNVHYHRSGASSFGQE